MRLLLGIVGIAAILACAGCVVLGTIVGTTLSYRPRATEQAVISATATAELPNLPAASGTLPSSTTLPEDGLPAPASALTPTVDSSTALPATGTNGTAVTPGSSADEGITTTAQIASGRDPSLPVAAGTVVTPSVTAASALTVQPLEVPGPSQALELTPTTQLTLSAVIFIENAGQFSPETRFQVRGATGGGVWLAADAIWLTFLQPETDPIAAAYQVTTTAATQPRQGVRLKFSFVGANPQPEIVPEERLDTHASYFSGSDAAGWHTNVPVWGAVRYRNLYPGIDLELSGQGGQYVQRLVVQPGVDLTAVRLRVDGAQSLTLEPLPLASDEPEPGLPGGQPPATANSTQVQGDAAQAGAYYLRLATALGDLSLPLLTISTADGSPLPAVPSPSLSQVDGNVVIASPFFIRGAPETRSNDNPILPATASPPDSAIHLLYSAFLGQGGNDTSRAIAVDALGSAYLTGDTYFPAFPAEPGVFDLASGGSYDLSAVKIDSSGSKLAYVTFFGGGGQDSGYGLAVDRAGNAYLAGQTTSADLPVTSGAFDSHYHAGSDGFVARLDPLGSALAYATFLGGDGDDLLQAIAVDDTGSAYVTGATDSTNFPATTGAHDVSYNGDRDAFVVKVNSAGSGLAYSTFLGGSSADLGSAIAVDRAGSAFVVGSSLSADWKTSSDAALPAAAGPTADAFVAKVKGDGTGLDYVAWLGGSGADYGTAVAVDGAGSAYLAGSSQSPDLPVTAWAFDTSLNGGYDAFVAKLDATGRQIEYAAYLGGPGDDTAQALAVDGLGYAYLAGSAGPFSLPQTTGAFDTSHNGDQDAFLVRIDELGTKLEYATFIGGSGQDRSQAIAVDALGSVYLAGSSSSPDFALAAGQWPAAEKGYVPAANPNGIDAFVLKLSAGTPFLDLPVSYTNFALSARGNVGDRGPGRVNSWFDHSTPNHVTNNRLTRWDGVTIPFSAASPSRIGESWYDGHGGIDLGWEVWNEPVYAAAPGTVIDTVTSCQVGQTSCGNYFGNRVWIDHGNGYATVYAHLKTVSVTKGTVISDPAAQPLGIMGNTGRSLGTHLHFAVYYDRNADGQWTSGEIVDPFGWEGSGRDPWSAPSRYLWKYPLAVRQIVGQAGDALLLSPSGLVTATIPAAALASPAAVELEDVPPTSEPAAQWHSTGMAFWLKADQPGVTSLLQPATVSLAYRAKDLVHLDPKRLTLYRWDESAKSWDPLATSVDPAQHQVTAQTADLGRFDLHAPLLCPADSIEPDDDHGAAEPIATDGITVSRLFDIKSDVDWFRVEAQATRIYTVRTAHLASGVTTVLRIYDPDSQSPLASGQAATGGGSYLQWQPPFDGSYLIQVSPGADSAYGCQASYELSVSEILAPSQVVVSGPAEGKIATRYTFTATVSPALAALPLTYVWQIDNQPPVTHTAGLSDTLTMAWTTSGPHSISVSAGNIAGKASDTRPLSIYNPALADFSATPISGPAPLQVTFSSSSSGDYTKSLWDLGDGSSSRSENPTHTYDAAGTYTVTLTVSGPGGSNVKTRVAYITVTQVVVRKSLGHSTFLPLVVRRR